MATNVQIKCIVKVPRDDPNESIDYVGGTNQDGSRWKLSLADAIAGIENGKWKFYVSVNGNSAWVVIAKSRAGNKYLKTEADDSHSNNLLSQPNCP